MFKPLTGKAHTKEYIENKSYREQYKNYISATTKHWITVLAEVKTIHLESDSFHYILTPTFYDKVYQLTTFNKDMNPLSHRTYETIEEIVKDNFFFMKSNTKIIESI